MVVGERDGEEGSPRRESTRIRISTALPNHASAEPGIPRTRADNDKIAPDARTETTRCARTRARPSQEERLCPSFTPSDIRQIPNTSSHNHSVQGPESCKRHLVYCIVRAVQSSPKKAYTKEAWPRALSAIAANRISATYAHYACLLESSLSLPAGPLLCGLNSR